MLIFGAIMRKIVDNMNKSKRYIFTSEKGKKYHAGLCYLIQSQHVYRFFYDQALKEGYEPCKVCVLKSKLQDKNKTI